MDKEIIMFGHIENILISNKISSGEKNINTLLVI